MTAGSTRVNNERESVLPHRRYRLTPAAEFYWEGSRLVAENYYRNLAVTVAPELAPVVLAIVGTLGEWRTLHEVREALPSVEPFLLLMAFSKLHEARIILADDDPLLEHESDLTVWDSWGSARRFHFSMRHVKYEALDAEYVSELFAQGPQPLAYKTYHDRPQIDLSRPSLEPSQALFQALMQRRTVRTFSDAPVSAEHLSTLLYLTWGRTGWIDSRAFGPLLRKTSPSGGARHPIEVYAAVRAAEGVPAGMYHYSVKDHALELLENTDREAILCATTPDNEPTLREAAVVFVMTGVFARSMWKYKNARAYRVLLMDAGHLGQTFHLVCTSLDLGPFTFAAFDEASVDATLGLDGIHEGALYMAATGHPRPSSAERA